MLTLDHLTREQRDMMDLIAHCPGSREVGLNGTTLDPDQRTAWQGLWEDGLADYVNDGAGINWFVLTDRGWALREAG